MLQTVGGPKKKPRHLSNPWYEQCLNGNLLSTVQASVKTLTVDEYWGLLQIGIMFLAFLAVVLIFVYLAYEKPSA